MGILYQGILGGFSGRIGNIVGSSWRSKNVIRALPKLRRNRIANPAQLEQRTKFRLASKLAGQLHDLIRQSYGRDGSKKAGNTACREILGSVIGGIYPDLVIDYSKLPVAKGKLSRAGNPLAASLQQGFVKFTWEDNSPLQLASPYDNAILVVYCGETQELRFKPDGAARFVMEDEIDVANFTGKQVHTWISFLSPDKRNAADSFYTGVVAVL